MKNNFQSKAVPRGTRTIWRYLSALFILFTFAIGNVWAAAGDAEVVSLTSGNITAAYAKEYAVTTDYDVLADGAVYATSRNAITANATNGIEPNYMGILFKPLVNCKVVIKGVNTTTSDRNFGNKVFEVDNTDIYPMVKASSSYNGSISKYLLNNYSSYTTRTQSGWKEVKLIKYSSNKYQEDATNAAKTITGESAQSSLYTQVEGILAVAITKKASSGAADVVESKTISTATAEYVFQAGKTYVLYMHRNSSGVYVKEISFVPVYQLTWALDGGSITSAADAYTNAGYYAKGTELTAPTVAKAGADFAGWSPAVAATMPAAATTYTATWATACSAGVPGNVTKGALTAGEITLTAEGSAASGDTWYWQTSESGVDKTNDGSSFVATAAGSYYVRSYNTAADCWNVTAKSIELTAEDFLATPTVTFDDGAYVVGASALDLSTLFESQNTSAVTFALKVASDDATVSGSNFTATKAGSYVIVATQAADANYKAVSEEATITVTWPATGAADILFNIATGTGNTALGTASKEAHSASINTLSNFTAAGGLTVSGLGAGKDGLSTKLETLSEKDASKYIYVTFNVEEGYIFTINTVTTKVVAVTSPKTIEVALSDATTNESLNYNQTNNSSAASHEFEFAGKAYEGTVTLKIYAYGAADHYRLAAPLTISGTVAVKPSPAAPSITAPTADSEAEYDLNDVITPLTITATGYPTPTYQWYKNNSASTEGATAIEGAQSANYTPANDVASNLYYYCVVSNSQGSATSHYFHVTVNAPTVPTIYTETTALTLTSNKVATASETFTFSGANLGETAVTLVLASAVDGLTLSEASVAPTAGAITDKEITVSYKSLLDVTPADVNLYLKQGDDILHTIVLTYSSTAGIEDLTSISAATTWNWTSANSSTEAVGSIDANNIVVLANYTGWVDAFNANAIAGRLQYVYRDESYAQGHSLKFNTTIPGRVSVKFSNTGKKDVARAPRITASDGVYAATEGSFNTKEADKLTYSHNVAAGDVLIEGFEMQEGTPANMLRFYEVRFVPTFSVTYMPNGGSGAESIVDDAATEVRAGSIFTAPASSAFVEWNTQADGNGDTYLPGAAVTADLTLFAQWETSYMVTFDLQGHGDAIEPQNIVSGGKVVKPADPSADAWEFGGWYKESTCENEWDFATDVVTTTTTIFAKWTADPCPSPYSLSKVVLTSASDGTVTGYNNDEYAGEKVIGGLGESQTADVDPSHEGAEAGYKLSSGGSAIVFATLKKGTFQVGDRVVVTITKAQDAYKVEEVAQPILDIYYGTDKNDATFLTTIENVTAAGSYTYRLTAADVTAIGSKKGIGVFRPSSGRTQNPYVYSVEIKGCREWAIFHTLTFKNIDGTATIAAESLEEGAAASTIAPTAPKIAMKRFLGWAEATDGTPVDLTTYTITEDKILYAVYENIVCPTTGTVYKFQLKTDLTNGNIFTSAPGELTLNTTDHLSSMVNGEVTVNLASGKNTNRVQFYDGKAIGFANGDGASITLTLDCALATGDEIRFINYAGNGNKMNLSDGTHSLELNGNSAETVQKITVNSDWNGADELTLTRGNNTPKLTYFEIYRPAKYTVSFDMKGHGSAIADIEDVIEGSKIAAPSPAPTDVDYSFAGWYKENTLENEWKFDVDVVETNTTLYAKWLDKSDATLKSLKYGDTEIALEDGVYTYEVNVPGFLTAVPALTAVTSNPSATAAVTDATEFDGEGKATSTVEVTPEKEGAAHQIYTVKFTKLPLYTDIVDVTGYTEWSWDGVATAEVKINDVANRGVILANYIDAPNFEMLAGQENARAYRSNSYPAYQGTYLKFHATVPGRLTINARNSSGSPILRVNGIDLATLNGTRTNYVTAVPAGDVEITSSADEIRIYAMTFDPAVDYTRDVTEGKYGTICLPTNGVMIGTTIYTLAFYGATSQKIFFDEVVTGRMEAGKPYLFLPEQGVTELKVFYTDSETKAAQTVNGFHGYIGDSEDPEDALPVPAGEGNYIVQNNTYREVQAGATAYILSHRAYIHFDGISTTEPAKAPGARRIGLGKDAAQGFENIESGDQPMKVMIDGTLYIIRGEKVYNANGQVVK